MREFCELAFARVGLPLTWEGQGDDEKGLAVDGRVLVAIDPAYFRPTEVGSLLGDAAKAKAKLGWKPRVRFQDLVAIMVDSDLALAGSERAAGDRRGR